MDILVDLGVQHVVLFFDSQLATQQMLVTYERKEERMIVYAKQAEEPLKKLCKFKIIQIPREEYVQADKLAHIANSA